MNSNALRCYNNKVHASYVLLCLGFIFFLLLPTNLIFGGVRGGVFIFISMLSIYWIYCFAGMRVSPALFFFLLMCLPIVISLILNTENLIKDDFYEILRPAFYASVFLFAKQLSQKVSLESIFKILSLFLILEFIIVVMQRLEVELALSVVSLIWDTEKNWSQRNTGTFSNPNVLGFYVVLSSIALLFSRCRVLILLVILPLAFSTILLTGSRTSLLTFIFGIVMTYIMLYKKNSIAMLGLMLIIPILLGLAYWSLSGLVKYNWYMGEMLQALKSFDLSEVTTFSQRLEHWSYALELLRLGETYNLIFGLGPGKGIGLRYVDNEYIAALVKYGFFGMLLTYVCYAAFYIKIFAKRKINKEMYVIHNICLLFFIMMIISGGAMETFTSWQYPFMLFFFLGLGWGKIVQVTFK